MPCVKIEYCHSNETLVTLACSPLILKEFFQGIEITWEIEITTINVLGRPCVGLDMESLAIDFIKHIFMRETIVTPT